MAAPAALAQQMWTVPGVVKASGQNGTHYVSDLVMTNPGTEGATVTLNFVPSLEPLQDTYTVGAGQICARYEFLSLD